MDQKWDPVFVFVYLITLAKYFFYKCFNTYASAFFSANDKKKIILLYKEILIMNTAGTSIYLHAPTQEHNKFDVHCVVQVHMLQLSCQEREGGHLELRNCDLR